MTSEIDTMERNLLRIYEVLYPQAVEQVATALRPRFESGELHAMREAQKDEDGITDAEPIRRVEDAVRDHFGLDVEVLEHTPPGYTTYQGDDAGAYLVLAVSPAAQAEEDSVYDGWPHIAFAAKAWAAWDVVFTARKLGFYAPSSDEEPGPGTEFASQPAEASP